MDMTPIMSKEMYLAKIAGEYDADLPEPRSREEYYLDKIAQGGNASAGTDGVSPTVTISKSNGVTTVTITDINGDHVATINDGADGTPGVDGYTPVKGTDYFTADDIAEIVAAVIEQIGAAE